MKKITIFLTQKEWDSLAAEPPVRQPEIKTVEQRINRLIELYMQKGEATDDQAGIK